MYNFMLSIFSIALIATIVFLVFMLRSKKHSKRRRRMMQYMIIGIVFVFAVPWISVMAGISDVPSSATVKNTEKGFDHNTDKNGKYALNIVSDSKDTNIKIISNKYITKIKNGKNHAQAIVQLPNNVDNTNIEYIGSAKGMNSDDESDVIHNHSNAYKQLQADKAKKASDQEAKEDAQEEATEKKQAQQKAAKEAQYKAQYPPIEDRLSNPLNATEAQQGQSYSIQGKVIDMAAFPTGMQYIIQDNEGNKFFTFVDKGTLKGGPRANLDDELTIYANSIFPDTISQTEVDKGMIDSHAGEKVTNALADRVYLKRAE